MIYKWNPKLEFIPGKPYGIYSGVKIEFIEPEYRIVRLWFAGNDPERVLSERSSLKITKQLLETVPDKIYSKGRQYHDRYSSQDGGYCISVYVNTDD